MSVNWNGDLQCLLLIFRLLRNHPRFDCDVDKYKLCLYKTFFNILINLYIIAKTPTQSHQSKHSIFWLKIHIAISYLLSFMAIHALCLSIQTHVLYKIIETPQTIFSYIWFIRVLLFLKTINENKCASEKIALQLWSYYIDITHTIYKANMVCWFHVALMTRSWI